MDQKEKAIALLNMQNALIGSDYRDAWGKDREPPVVGASLTLG
jgi:hypothetical protein